MTIKKDPRTQLFVRYAFSAMLCLALWELMSGESPAQNRPRIGPTSPTMIYEGFTEPRHDVMVAATEIGRLEQLHVEVGDQVDAGQVLGRLENALQLSSVKIAALQASMKGELEAARAEADLNRTRAETLRELAESGMARPDELVRAETDLRVASARQLASEEQTRLRQLELERFRLQLQRREIRAPMDGVISEIFHQPGEYITPGDPAVVRLLVMDVLFAVFNVPVEDVVAMTPGTPVRVFLRSSSTTIDAAVTSVAPDIDGESGTVRVRVKLDNAERKLLAGDRCTLRLAPRSGRTAMNKSAATTRRVSTGAKPARLGISRTGASAR